MSLAILVPVLARPQNVAPLLASILTSTPAPYRVLFICDPGDIAEQDAIAKAGGAMISPGGTYAAKINAGVDATDDALLFLGADDLRFTPGWLDAATAKLTGDVQVVGVADGVPRPHRPQHATHFLMTRQYAQLPTLDGKPGPLCTDYHHAFIDDELLATTAKRGVYAYAPDAHVNHYHWMNGMADDDDVYRLGRLNYRRDRNTFHMRRRMWRA